MRIKDLIIADGVIKHYTIDKEKLSMVFSDFRGTSYEILSDDIKFLSEKGSVGFDLAEGKFTIAKEGTEHWHFYDSDGLVLEVKLNGYSIRVL